MAFRYSSYWLDPDFRFPETTVNVEARIPGILGTSREVFKWNVTNPKNTSILDGVSFLNAKYNSRNYQLPVHQKWFIKLGEDGWMRESEVIFEDGGRSPFLIQMTEFIHYVYHEPLPEDTRISDLMYFWYNPKQINLICVLVYE